MLITLIVAMSENRVIGRDGALPWRLSADLKQFKRLTMGHHMIMGRKTFESIGKPLAGRTSIILTRSTGFAPPPYEEGGKFTVAHTLDEALAFARSHGESEVFVIGGAEIYAQSLPLADRIYLTLVEAVVEGDTFLPQLDSHEWVETEQWPQAADDKNEYPFVFKVLEKKAPPQ